jgi:hypothetical protein
LYKGNKVGLNDTAIVGDKLAQTHVLAVNDLVGRVSQDVWITVGAPDPTLGELNDKAIDLSSFIIYTKTAVATWTAGATIDGGANAFKLITSSR